MMGRFAELIANAVKPRRKSGAGDERPQQMSGDSVDRRGQQPRREPRSRIAGGAGAGVGLRVGRAAVGGNVAAEVRKPGRYDFEDGSSDTVEDTGPRRLRPRADSGDAEPGELATLIARRGDLDEDDTPPTLPANRAKPPRSRADDDEDDTDTDSGVIHDRIARLTRDRRRPAPLPMPRGRGR